MNKFISVRFLKENFILILISALAVSVDAGWALAQQQQQLPGQVGFTKPLNLSRGDISPGAGNGSYLTKEAYCKVVTENFGWSNCNGIDAFILTHTEGADTTIIYTPDSSGYVKMDDWESNQKNEAISQIENQLRASIEAQSKKIKSNIEFKGWRTYPTLNKEKKYMYYATDLVWDGQANINVKATVFDRRGYIIFDIVPISQTLTSEQIEALINKTLDLYKPKATETYASFQSGDKVAAVGALGVLASLVGVKYGKAVFGGVLAVALFFLKKFWFVLLIPLAFVGRLFFRKKKDNA